LGWFVIASAPVWAVLPYPYVEDSPRLQYEAAVGAALFWAIPLDAATRSRQRRLAILALGAMTVLSSTVVSLRFIRGRLPLYAQIERAVAGLAKARPNASDAALLCINYPCWFARWDNTYPLGREGVVVVPQQVEDLLWVNTGDPRPVKGAVYLDLLPQRWRYLYACLGPFVDADTIQPWLRQAGGVAVTRYEGEYVAVYDAGGLKATGQAPTTAYLAAFDDAVALLSAEAAPEMGQVRVELLWHCWRPPHREVTVFLHLYDAEGRLVSQADGFPVMGTSRLIAWQRGDQWRDVRLLPLPAGPSAGECTVKVGLYASADGQRLAATNEDGEAYPDAAVPLARLHLP